MELKVGDLVLVVGAGVSSCALGASGTVQGFRRSAVVLKVESRQLVVEDVYVVALSRDPYPQVPNAWGFPRRNLIKIDPPAEMKDTETEKELTV